MNWQECSADDVVPGDILKIHPWDEAVVEVADVVRREWMKAPHLSIKGGGYMVCPPKLRVQRLQRCGLCGLPVQSVDDHGPGSCVEAPAE